MFMVAAKLVARVSSECSSSAQSHLSRSSLEGPLAMQRMRQRRVEIAHQHALRQRALQNHRSLSRPFRSLFCFLKTQLFFLTAYEDIY
jgi:hypothetical protein